jgi:hypothetical protein
MFPDGHVPVIQDFLEGNSAASSRKLIKEALITLAPMAELYELLYELSCGAMRSLAHGQLAHVLKINNLAVSVRAVSPPYSAANRRVCRFES